MKVRPYGRRPLKRFFVFLFLLKIKKKKFFYFYLHDDFLNE